MAIFDRIPNEPKSKRITLGGREIETLGLPSAFWTDLYYRSMTVSWPSFFAGAAVIFLVLNGGFALIYSFGDQPIANAAPQRFLDLLYFSIETLATVGYGDMHPRTDYGYLVATIEIFTGMSFLAVGSHVDLRKGTAPIASPYLEGTAYGSSKLLLAWPKRRAASGNRRKL